MCLKGCPENPDSVRKRVLIAHPPVTCWNTMFNDGCGSFHEPIMVDIMHMMWHVHSRCLEHHGHESWLDTRPSPTHCYQNMFGLGKFGWLVMFSLRIGLAVQGCVQG